MDRINYEEDQQPYPWGDCLFEGCGQVANLAMLRSPMPWARICPEHAAIAAGLNE